MKLTKLTILLLSSILFELRYPAMGTVPDSLEMTEFRSIMTGFSEEPGHFPGDNFISNESSYLHVIPTVIKESKPGGVYIGVGTEQNYSYIAATRPEIAFIVDIRRENLLLHILYKALFNLSSDRTAFLMMLFSRENQEGKPNTYDRPDGSATVTEIVYYIETSTSVDSSLFKRNWSRVRREVGRYGIEERNDLDDMLYIYRSFYERQLSLRYADVRLRNGLSYPTFEDLITSTTIEGELASFLSTEESFGFVKNLHRRNLIIPVVGDFAGMKTFRTIASYAEAHDTRVSVFMCPT